MLASLKAYSSAVSRGSSQSLTVCPWPSWAGMHFTCQVLEPLSKLLAVAYV